MQATPASVVSKNGILKRFFRVISESMNPGMIVITFIPCGES